MRPADPPGRRAGSAKGKRLARVHGDETRGPERAGHQQTNWLRQKDGPQVSTGAGGGPTVWSEGEATEQTGCPQAVFARPAEGGRVERPSTAARVTTAWLPRRLHDFEGLAAAAKSSGDGNGGAPLRNASLVGCLPSMPSAGGRPPLFEHFEGITQPSDSPPACMLDSRLMAFSNRPAALSTTGVDGVSRFSRVEFPCMPGVSDCAESAGCLRWRFLRCCLPSRVTASAL